MLADDMPCNPRNNRPASVVGSVELRDIYGSNVEVDFRGEEVSVENFIRVLTARQHPDTPPSKRLQSDANSNIIIYLTGHGGVEFLKFQDSSEVSAQDFADAFEQMRIQGRYNEILFVTDTCQANTLNYRLASKNVMGVSSSLEKQNSYSEGHEHSLGVTIIDRFSSVTGRFIKHHSRNSNVSLAELFNTYRSSASYLMSDVGFKTDLLERPLNDVKLMDFFGSVQQTAPLGATRSIDGIDDRSKRHLHQQQHTEAELQLATGQTYATKVGLGVQPIPVNKEMLLGMAVFGAAVVWLSFTA